MAHSTPPETGQLWSAVRNILPLAFGVATYGLAFGLLAAQAGMDGLQTGLMGTFVFAGSSQIVLVERLVAGAGAMTAVLAGVALNMRLLLITASLRDELSGRPLWQIVLGLHMATDENWALLHTARNQGRNVGYWYLVGGGLCLLVTWVTSTVIGANFARAFPDPQAIGMDFAFTAAFIALLRGLWRGATRDLAPWVVSAATAVIAVLLTPLDPSWALVIAGTVGAITAGIRPDA